MALECLTGIHLADATGTSGGLARRALNFSISIYICVLAYISVNVRKNVRS